MTTKNKVTLNLGELKKLDKRLKGLDKLNVKVGMIQGKGAENDADGITMAELAAIHEFGAPKAGIPQRSFIRGAFKSAKTKKEMSALYARVAKMILASEQIDLKQPLGLIGLWGVSTIQQFIRKKIPPANAPATIARKKSSTPLVDTGRMLNAISFDVKKGGVV